MLHHLQNIMTTQRRRGRPWTHDAQWFEILHLEIITSIQSWNTILKISQYRNTLSAETNKRRLWKFWKKEKFFTVLWCAELTVREGGKKDFLPILMDPEKQGEEPRKVYVTSRWPIHNLWGGATMLLSFVHQAQHSPCSPLSTKKSQKVHQSQ